MGTNGSTATFQSDTLGSLGLGNHVQTWKEDSASADVLGLEWAALQGKYYGGGDSVKYVTKGSVVACDSGSLFTRIDLAEDHGIEVKSNHLPILTTLDFGSQNISPFGICSKKLKTATTKYEAKCKPQIINPWMQNKNTTKDSSRAAILQADAFAVCSTGGLICVKEINKTPQESFMAILQERYGFDERTIKIILELHKAIQEKFPDESQISRDWRFTRLLGGLTYGLKEKEGWEEEFIWNETAGDATYALRDSWFGQKSVDLPVKQYMMEELGLSSEDYEYLQYKVRIQNFLVGKDAADIKYISNQEINQNYLGNMNTGLGRSLKDTNFIEIWNQQCDDMCGMIDFSHQQITTATILATEVSKNGTLANLGTGGDRQREQMAGWLGDATAINKITKKTSFGNDDYMADLDAENIGYMIRNEGYSYIEAIEDYYGSRLLDDNRAEQFLENNDLDDVKQLIRIKLIVPKITKELKLANDDLEKIQQIMEKYAEESYWLSVLKDGEAPDTYNFIRSLEQQPRPLPEIGDFK